MNDFLLCVSELLEKISPPELNEKYTFDTKLKLYALATDNLGVDRRLRKDIDFLAKRIDITGKVFVGYEASGKRATEDVLEDGPWMALLLTLFVQDALCLEMEKRYEELLKRINVIFKIRTLFFRENSDVTSSISDTLSSLLGKVSNSIPTRINLDVTDSYQHCERETSLKELDVTILFYEGPIARAYLETIISLGFKPKKIINLIAEKDIATKKPVGRFLPKVIKLDFASSIQRTKIHYWPRWLRKNHTDLTESVIKTISSSLGFKMDTLRGANEMKPLNKYSGSVESVLVDGLDDPRLIQILSQQSEGSILYTGGGIVPESVLSIPKLKFIHIHPGYLPDIKGADCTLWSTLLTGQTSATCFYMSPGIDTGNIIQPCWLPNMSFDNIGNVTDMSVLYRLTYSYIDPWIRAFVLSKVIYEMSEYITEMPSVQQDPSTGLTFHFMHDKLRELVCSKIFNMDVNKPNSEEKIQ